MGAVPELVEPLRGGSPTAFPIIAIRVGRRLAQANAEAILRSVRFPTKKPGTHRCFRRFRYVLSRVGKRTDRRDRADLIWPSRPRFRISIERWSCTSPPAEGLRPHGPSEDAMSSKPASSKPARSPMTSIANLQIRNGLLATLSADDLSLLAPHLREEILLPGDLLHRPGEKIEQAYFLQSGIVSLMAVLKGGTHVETASIGREGAIGTIEGFGSLMQRAARFDQPAEPNLAAVGRQMRRRHPAEPRIPRRDAGSAPLERDGGSRHSTRVGRHRLSPRGHQDTGPREAEKP